MGLTANGDVVRLRAFVAAALLLGAYPAVVAAGTPLQVTRSDAQVLGLEARDLAPTWRVTGDGTHFDLHVPGTTTSGPLGGWRVPSSSRWLVVPPGTSPRLVVVQENWQDGSGRRLAYESLPATRPGRDVQDQGFIDVMVEPGRELPPDLIVSPKVVAARRQGARPRSGPALELGEVKTWRGRRIVSLTFVPVRHRADGTVAGVLSSGSWQVRFVADDATGVPSGVVRLETRNDEHFAGAFLNPALLSGLPSEAAYHGGRPPLAAEKSLRIRDVVLEAPEVRIGVAATDLHRVSAARLRERGLLTATVDESQVRLYQRRYVARLDDGSGAPPYAEIEVPLHMVGEGDAFDDDDFFVFYGLRLRDDTDFTADLGEGPETVPGCGDNGEWNNDYNVYWLAVATPPTGVQWARMETTTLAAADGPAEPNYRRVEYHEEQAAFRHQIATRQSDRLYYNRHWDPDVTVGFSPRWSPDPAGTPWELEVGASAFADSEVAVVHVVDVTLTVQDGPVTDLGTMRLGTVTDRVFRFTGRPASALLGQSASVTFTPDSPRMWSYINWVRISYDALYRAVGDRLEFHSGDQAGPRRLEVAGFTDPGPGLFEVTDPRRPRFVALTGANVVDAGGNWTLSIQPDQPAADQPRRYLAMGDWQGVGIREFNYYDAIVVDDPQDPLVVSAAPDVLVVTHGEFRAALEPWLDHRRARSGGPLDIHVVDVQDLYDRYSGGLRDAWAIRRFVRYALDHSGWGSWALVLVGDANENARELAVRPEARAWSKDWVPTHYHVQAEAVTGIYELMATDKWFVCSQTGETDATDDFPDRADQPWDMYLGRLPCNSVAELDRIIDKVVAMETHEDGQDWRRRAVIIADDSWSDGYGALATNRLVWKDGDTYFARSQTQVVGPTWSGGSPVALEANVVELSEWLDPLYPGYPPEVTSRPVVAVREDTRAVATPRLVAALSQGGLFAHFQGHANIRVLSSEYWMADYGPWDRRDIDAVSNTGRPFVFFGMGCHVADWAQSPAAIGGPERSYCEKFLVNSRAGAAASYGSSGYEFINVNRDLSEQHFETWLDRPPVAGPAGGSRSRWMLGEMLWASEAEFLARHGSSNYYREAAAQYVLLGDPLMMLDAGPPQVTATLRGDPDQEISGEADVAGLDATNLRTIAVVARDEAGIDRLRVTDSRGVDFTSQVVVVADSLPAGEADHQEVYYELAVPVRPFDHTLDVDVWDTGAPLSSDRHWTLTLNMGQDVEFTALGEVVDPDVFQFVPGQPVAFTGNVTSAAWLHGGMTMDVDSDNLTVADVVFDLDKTNTMTVSFTATAAGGIDIERSVDLIINEHRTTWVLQAGEQSGAAAATIGQVYSYPNPLRSSTRIVFETDATSCQGVVRVFSPAGRTIARLPVDYDGNGSGIVPWDGRDAEGDEVANGTYLYRIELAGPDGSIASSVQRLVVMR